MNNKREIYRCLEDVFNYKEFKSKVQKDAVNAVVNGIIQSCHFVYIPACR